MSFFKGKHKKLALNNTKESLEQAYAKSERNLVRATRTGDEKEIRKAMKEHGTYEYAMLYTFSPEYEKKVAKLRHSKRRP